MEGFETLLEANRGAVERFVKFRVHNAIDADDILQDTYLSAFLKFGQLRSETAFKSWLLSIARNKCNDYFRKKATDLEIPLDMLPEWRLVTGVRGRIVSSPVEDTLDKLGNQDRQILYLCYWKNMPQADIAKQLGVPLGTVKSRLHTARERFRENYPQAQKGEWNMTKLPEYMPRYTIERLDEEPFICRWEETQGWMIIPRVGEKLTWGMYDFPARKRTEYTEIEVTGKAQVHGIEGVEIVAKQYDAANYFRTGSQQESEWRFIAQLTDTHTRFLAASSVENGVHKVWTFLDGEEFMNNWGFGPDNCGNEVNLHPKGLLSRDGDRITGVIPREVVDVVGRYCVTIGDKVYDTVCVMDIECFNDAVASEQYLDRNGRTVLWRRFNRDDWAIDRFGGKPWSEKLPENQRIYINGETYVHWYDCLTDYVL